MDLFSKAVLQPLGPTTQKQQSNEPVPIVIGLETQLPDALYKVQRNLFVYHDRAEQEVETLVKEFNVRIFIAF